MTEIIEQHLKKITPNNLRDFRNSKDCFSVFASGITNIGKVELGITGRGFDAIRTKNETISFPNALQAVNAYIKLFE